MTDPARRAGHARVELAGDGSSVLASIAAETRSRPGCRSFGWARATGRDGATVSAITETGDSCAFTAAAGVRAVEEALSRSLDGALSPAEAFGTDFVLTVEHTARTIVPGAYPRPTL